MDGAGDAGPGFDLFRRPDAGGQGVAAGLGGDVGGLRDDEAGIRALGVVIRGVGGRDAGIRGAAAGERGHDDAVGQMQIADGDGLQDGGVGAGHG